MHIYICVCACVCVLNIYLRVVHAINIYNIIALLKIYCHMSTLDMTLKKFYRFLTKQSEIFKANKKQCSKVSAKFQKQSHWKGGGVLTSRGRGRRVLSFATYLLIFYLMSSNSIICTNIWKSRVLFKIRFYMKISIN